MLEENLGLTTCQQLR